MKTLDDWQFVVHGCIRGKLDGEYVRTTAVVARNPETNTIQTKSGSIYKLLQHSGVGYPEDMIWDASGWIAGGIKKAIPRIERENDR